MIPYRIVGKGKATCRSAIAAFSCELEAGWAATDRECAPAWRVRLESFLPIRVETFSLQECPWAQKREVCRMLALIYVDFCGNKTGKPLPCALPRSKR